MAARRPGPGPLVAQLSKLREVLVTDARALVARGQLDAAATRGLRGGRAHADLCLDVLQVASALRAGWSAIEGRTGLTLEELDRAEALVDRLAAALGERAHAGPGEAAELRARAFTRLVETWDDVRRLVTFLRWKAGDYDRIAPSFYEKRAKRG